MSFTTIWIVKNTRFLEFCILKEKWVVLDDSDSEYPVNKIDFSFILNDKKIVFDCVFNAIHGVPGENGMLLAYFDLIHIKHTSAPFYQMALTFNKRDTLSIVKEYGIKTATSVYLNQGNPLDSNQIIRKVGLPCFVKPNNAGSSFGISKVHTEQELLPAIENAYKEDSAILIESFLDGVEGLLLELFNTKMHSKFYRSLRLFQRMISLIMKRNMRENLKRSPQQE